MSMVIYTCGLSTRKLQQDFDINLDYIVRLKKPPASGHEANFSPSSHSATSLMRVIFFSFPPLS